MLSKEVQETMQRVRHFLLCSAVLLTAALGTAGAQSSAESVKSPDGNLEFTFETASGNQPAATGGQLGYRVSYRGKPLILRSQLGLELQNTRPLGAAVTITSASRGSADETYRLVVGKANPVRDRYNSLRIEVTEAGESGRKLVMEARAYDDGVAFRYVMPEQAQAGEFRLVKEGTQFRISKDAIAYPILLRSYRTSYENEFVRLNLTRIDQDMIVGLPLLMEAPGVAWVAITEAGLDQYAGMYLCGAPGNGNTLLQMRLSPNLDDPKLAVIGSLPHRSPWRVLLVGDEPGRLIESNMLVNLNPPSAIADTSWIKPGKSAWSWWSGNSTTGSALKGGMNTETMKYYTDFAADAGLEYLLVDGGWSSRNDVTKSNPNIDVPEIVRYAGSKKVKVWLWLHWTSVDKQMEQAFPLYEKWGIVGVKIDFMDSNDQRMVDFYHRVAKKAAEHHLMVDYHGAYPPNGMQRTWPNVLTHEGVMGLEYLKWSASVDPDHNVMLAFTRMLAGPMDYTPGGFDNRSKGDLESRNRDPMVMGTRAHQLALYAVFESPLQMVSDRPGAYEGQPTFEFIRSVPTSFDETRVISGEVGQYITVARRQDKEWYVGSITNWTARNLEIPMSFLGAGNYSAEIYADAPDADRLPKNVTISKQRVNRTTKLSVRLAPGGGHAMRIRPQ